MDDPGALDAIGRQIGPVAAFVEDTARRIALASARLGERVALDASVLDRGDSVSLATPGQWSANRSCRMITARDGWIAANLPRPEDLHSIPALLGTAPDGEPWEMLIGGARTLPCTELTSRAEILGLAIASVGETPAHSAPCGIERLGERKRGGKRLCVIDFSSLWAGPLCGSVFAAMGAEVVKIESRERPDTTAQAAPLLDHRLNGAKRKKSLAIRTQAGLAELCDEIAACDVLITSARARALAALGLTREALFAANPGLIWIAITGHGWRSGRVAFGDDAAAAGNLVAWRDGEPIFVGDALADPLTGLAATACALEALAQGSCACVDAALAQTAAYVASGVRPL